MATTVVAACRHARALEGLQALALNCRVCLRPWWATVAALRACGGACPFCGAAATQQAVRGG